VVPPSSIGPHELVLYTIIGFHSSFHSLTVLSPDAEASTVEETSASALTHLECPVRVARQVCVCKSHEKKGRACGNLMRWLGGLFVFIDTQRNNFELPRFL
jgi:hypothetical protein